MTFAVLDKVIAVGIADRLPAGALLVDDAPSDRSRLQHSVLAFEDQQR